MDNHKFVSITNLRWSVGWNTGWHDGVDNKLLVASIDMEVCCRRPYSSHEFHFSVRMGCLDGAAPYRSLSYSFRAGTKTCVYVCLCMCMCVCVCFFLSISQTVGANRLYRSRMDLPLAVIWHRFLDCFIVTPWMSMFSLEYVENDESLLLLKRQIYINIMSSVWGQYGSNLGSLRPLGGNTKYWQVAADIGGSNPGS